MNRDGLGEDEAYSRVLSDWKRQQRFERIELKLAMQQAREIGHGGPIGPKEEGSTFEQRLARDYSDARAKLEDKMRVKRREKMETALEEVEAKREAIEDEEERARFVADPLQVFENDVTQEDFEALLENKRLAEFFGEEAQGISLEIERLIPRPEKDRKEFEEFKQFLHATMGKEMKERMERDGLKEDKYRKYFENVNTDYRKEDFEPSPKRVDHEIYDEFLNPDNLESEGSAWNSDDSDEVLRRILNDEEFLPRKKE